jgi:hypothetical protein
LAQPAPQIAPHPLCIPHNLVAIEREIEFALVGPEFDLAGQTPASMIRANSKADLAVPYRISGAAQGLPGGLSDCSGRHCRSIRAALRCRGEWRVGARLPGARWPAQG